MDTRLPTLPSNKNLTQAILQSTTRKLEKILKLEEYHTVMEQQLEQGILGLVPEPATGEVIHYIPHHPEIREEVKFTKMRMVYDCSADNDPQPLFLNNYLEVGPLLQPMIFDILKDKKENA